MGVHQVKIRITKGFSGYKPGQVFDWGDGMARIYIARGMVEEVKDEPVERAVRPQPLERAVIDPPIRRKGK